ncbi:hypothetical protein COU59_00480 [Candidatus Pacearchaeota archaeon CG10_big_fil_rev_8_21_14_0_10_34_12]|nr:MAG: hypothetical protein COU59_00480 [Candidatus Pacearchaeota archaeon CG10_big_fil_rev_8_21_14_0_10_34_12]
MTGNTLNTQKSPKKSNGFWKEWKNLRGEMKRVIAKNDGKFPTSSGLREIGENQILNSARTYFGGLPEVRRKMGYGEKKPKPNGTLYARPKKNGISCYLAVRDGIYFLVSDSGEEIKRGSNLEVLAREIATQRYSDSKSNTPGLTIDERKLPSLLRGYYTPLSMSDEEIFWDVYANEWGSLAEVPKERRIF